MSEGEFGRFHPKVVGELNAWCAAHQKRKRRNRMLLRSILLSLVAIGISIWISGAILALNAATFSPGVCRAPYREWAITWPIWPVAPRPVLIWMQVQAMKVCGDGR